MERDNVEDIYPATPLQAGLLFNTFRDRSAYLNQMKWTVQYELNVDKLQLAIEQICDAFDIFRTRFVSTTKGVYMILQRKVMPRIQIVGDVNQYCMDDFSKGFSEDDSMWFRMAVCYPSTGITKLVFTIHHVLYDGWCFNRIINAIFAAYEGFVVPKSIPFKRAVDYILSVDKEITLSFWKKYLEAIEPDAGFKQSEITNVLNSKPVKFTSRIDILKLKQSATFSKITIATITKAAWALTLKVYQQRDSVIFGNVISGRELPVEGIER